MAVVALRGVRVSQLRYLAMERFKIAIADLFVTMAALVHDMQPEIGSIGAGDTVGRMAFAAHGQALAGAREPR